MKRFTLLSVLTVFAVGVLQFAPVHAQETTATDEPDRSAMLELIQQLTAQIEQLQAQVNAQRESFQAFREEVRAGLAEGARGEDVRKIQELLATDPEIYPEQLVTGYFGGLTQGALRRFQERHDLTPTGSIDEETRELLNQYLSESDDGTVRPGLLQSPGIQNAIERGVCERTNGRPPFCPDATSSDDDDDDDDDYRRPGRPDWAGRDDDDDDDNDEDEDEDNEDDNEDREDTREDAADAIEDAADEIEDAREDLEDTDEFSEDTQARVEAMLETADTRLDEAQDAFDDEEYEEAIRLAGAAEAIADRAEDMLDDDDDDVLVTCGRDDFVDLLGQTVPDQSDLEDRWEEYHDEDATSRSVRVIGPGEAVTQDYIETRLNVYVDEDDVVEEVTCG